METTIPAAVAAVERVSPGFARLRLDVGDGAGWESTGVGDEFVHVDFGADTVDAADGHASRHYTVSRVVDGGFELEVALHGHGPGALWGTRAVPGDRVSVSAPKAYYSPPSPDRLRVLLGDATAVPAIARILADAGAEERFRIVIELADLADARDLPTAATVDVDWRIGGNAAAPTCLQDAAEQAVEAARAAGGPDPYVWVACESTDSRKIRTRLRAEMGVSVRDLRIVGYWHRDRDKALAVWNAATDEQRAAYAALWREDRTDEENWVDAEPFLRSLGV